MTRLTILALALLLTSPSGAPAPEAPNPVVPAAGSTLREPAHPGSGPSARIAGTSGDADSVDGLNDVRQGRSGIWTHMGAGYPDDYLALPIGPGHTVVACGPARCLTLTSTDAGPARSALLRGIIGDLSVALFTRLCGCSPSQGRFEGSWRLAVPEARPKMTLPPTSTLPDTLGDTP